MQTQSTEAEIFTYLVRQRFLHQPEKFNKYTKLLRDLCSKREDPSYGIPELKKMFADHKDLLIGLNNFLPKNHETTNKIPVLDFQKNNNNSPLKSTVEFVNKVHRRFADNNERVFVRFCDIMSMYQNKQVTINEVNRLFTDLFQNDPDLYVEFTRFMVDEFEDAEDFDNDPAREFVFASGNKGRTRRINLYEETLAIWETYKYELDMVYLRIKSTGDKLKKLKKGHIKIEEFQFQDFKCMKLLYGRADEEDGEAMVQQLLSNPVLNALTINSRMEKKRKEIKERKILMDRIWDEILEDIREGRREVRHSCFLDKVRREWVTCVY